MALFRVETKPVSRSGGRSAVAAAAYRVRGKLTDERTGLIHNYSKESSLHSRASGLSSADIVTPTGVDVERGALWNAAEVAETRKDGRTAREWVIALPHELNEAARRDLALAFAGELVERYGVAADVCIHEPDAGGDNRNHHAHILTTTRTFSLEQGKIGLGEKTEIELNNKKRAKLGLCSTFDEIKDIRKVWETQINQAMELHSLDVRVTSKSLKDQGSDLLPQIKLGPVATQMERAAKKAEAAKAPVVNFSDRGDINRRIAAENAEMMQVTAQIIDLKAERDRRDALALELKQQQEQERVIADAQLEQQREQARVTAELRQQQVSETLARRQAEAAALERQQQIAEYVSLPLEDLQAMANMQTPRSVDDRIYGRENVSKARGSADKIKDKIKAARAAKTQINTDASAWRAKHWLQSWLFKEPRGVAAFRRQFNEQAETIKKLQPALTAALAELDAQRHQVRGECEQDYREEMTRFQGLPLVVAIEQVQARERALKSLSDAPQAKRQVGLDNGEPQQEAIPAPSQGHSIKPSGRDFGR